MTKKEIAILSSLAALCGCKGSTEAEARYTREHGPRITMQVIGNMDKAFKKGLDPDAKLPPRELPTTWQKSKGKSR